MEWEKWCDSQGATLLGAALIVLATVAAYSNSFSGVFVFDDESAIARNPTIRELFPIWKPLCPPSHGEAVSGRPILNLSLALNYAVSGFDVRSYHVTNLERFHFRCSGIRSVGNSFGTRIP